MAHESGATGSRRDTAHVAVGPVRETHPRAVVLVIGPAIAYSLIFTSFPQRVSFQWEFSDGERIPISHITCPSRWSVLVHDAEPEGVVGCDICVLPTPGQVAPGIVIAAVSLALGVWIMTREIRWRPLPELSESVRQLRRKEAP